MSISLRDQLLKLGFDAPKPEPKAPPRPASKPPHRQGERPGERGKSGPGRGPAQRPPGTGERGRSSEGRSGSGHPGKAHSASGKPAAGQGAQGRPGGERTGAARPKRGPQEFDLGKAYALRAQQEKDERIAAEREKQEAARLRREARAKLTELVRDKGLNAADADVARHFEYGGKIKRIHVTAEQLRALNAGELGVLQVEGRYVLVDAALLAEAETIFPQAVALKVDPNAPAGEDPYADPKYQVPDDLIW